jgi:ligand-binding sensor domain-containing protein/serine phosphatase RsbU (regulator of sigma subunit)
MMLPQALKKALFLILFLATFCSYAEHPHFKFYDLLKAHPKSDVNVVFQDSKGFMWIGTTEGVFLFDGLNFKQYSEEDSLGSNVITCIAEDDQNRIWLGHKKGKVSVLDRNSGAFVHKAIDSIFNSKITAIEFLIGGQIVVASEGDGMLIIEGDNYSVHSSTTDGFDDYIYDVAVAGAGQLWLASDAGVLLYSMSSNTWTSLNTKNGLPDNIIANLDLDPKGRCWIATKEKGIAYYNVDQGKVIAIPNWNYGEINAISVKTENDVWVSTQDSGVVRLTKAQNGAFEYNVYNSKRGLNGATFNSVFKDNEGHMWIGSDKGLSFGSYDIFQFFTTEDGLPEMEIVALDFDAEGRLWLASSTALYLGTKGEQQKFQFKKLSKGWGAQAFSCIFASENGPIWVGSLGDGLYVFDSKTLSFKHVTEKEGLSNNNVISINSDEKVVWVSTLGGGVSRFSADVSDDFKYKVFQKKDGLGSNYIYASLVDKNGTTWLAKDGGGGASIKDEVVAKDIELKVLSNVTYGIIEDHQGSRWYTTANKGLIKTDGDKYDKITIKNGLLSNSYSSAAVNPDGLCLFASNEGITVIDPKTMQINNYKQEAGLAFMQPNLNAIACDAEGAIWVGTNKGLIKFKASKAALKEARVDVMITETLVQFNQFNDSLHVLNHDQNHLIIKYLGLSYQSPEKVQYRYKMEGLDLDWVHANKARAANYSGLAPGTYSFVVQATVADNRWRESDSASYSFIINAPFWKTLWFGIICTIGVVLVFILIVKLREKQFKYAERKLKLEVGRRTQEITLQKYEIEQQRNEILGQNNDITDSIRYAKRIQGAILPDEDELKLTLKDYFVLYQPKDIVAGDFYWLKSNENRVLFAAADCTGHGVPGALVSVVCHNGLERACTEFKLDDPGLILDKTREIITQQFFTTKEDVNDGMDISLCAIEGGELFFAGANNPIWIVRDNTQPEVSVKSPNSDIQIKRHEGESHSVWEVKGDKQPVGKFYNFVPFTTKSMKLLPGDTIYLFTDGLPDQFGGEKGKKLKLKGFREYVLSQQNKELAEQKIAFKKFFESWRGNLEQVDDVCLFAVKIEG